MTGLLRKAQAWALAALLAVGALASPTIAASPAARAVTILPPQASLDQIAAAGDVMFAFEGGATSRRTEASGLVAQIDSRVPGLNALSQSNASLRPLAAGRATQTDGVATYLTQGNDRGTLSGADAVTVADGAGAVLGNGFTVTGLGKLSGGDFIVGNHGRETGGDASFTPSIVRVGSDRTTLVWEVTLASLGLSLSGSPQGLVVLPDDTSWTAIGGLGVLVHLAPNGSLLGTVTGLATNINAVAYDSAYPDCLILGYGTSTMSWTRLSDKVVVKTVTLTNTPDMLVMDAARNWLWFSYGTDAVSGNLSAFSLKTNSLVGNYVSTTIDCVEGFVFSADGLHVDVANDAGFHAGASGKNQIIRFAVTPFPTGPPAGASFGFGWAGQIPSTKASTGAILVAGQPSLTSAGTTGFGIYIPTSSSTVQNLIIQNQTFSFNSPLLAWHVYWWNVDLTAKTIEFFIDGNSQGVTSITAVTAAFLTANNVALGAEHRAAGPVTYGKVSVGAMVGVINTSKWQRPATAWLTKH